MKANGITIQFHSKDLKYKKNQKLLLISAGFFVKKVKSTRDFDLMGICIQYSQAVTPMSLVLRLGSAGHSIIVRT